MTSADPGDERSYNIARYDDFLSFCYGGQTRGEGSLEVAPVGRNLSNEYYTSGTSTEAPLTGQGTGSPVGVLADQVAPVNRPREIGLQFAARF